MKEWTAEERRLHGEKIAATKARNAETRATAEAAQRAWEEQQKRLVDEALAALPPVRPDTPRILTWHDLPRDARKSARNPRVPDNAPVHKARCNNCRLEYWTRDDKLEDICETCEFVLIDEKHRLRRTNERSRGGKLVNPFAQQNTVTRTVNPFGGGVKL